MKSQGRSCEGKNRLTREQARAVVREIIARNQRRGGDKHHVNAYACEFCGTYHVGHTSAPKPPPYKRRHRCFVRQTAAWHETSDYETFECETSDYETSNSTAEQTSDFH